MIDINETVRLPASEDEVWAVLSDPHQVVGLIADAEITSENTDGTYNGRMTVKFGPMRVSFVARVALDLDQSARTGTITAHGKDSQGGTRMKTTASLSLASVGPEVTDVSLEGTVELSGRLASQIEGAAGSVVKRMSSEFTDALAARLGPEPIVEAGGEKLEVTPTGGIFSRITAWFSRLFRRAAN